MSEFSFNNVKEEVQKTGTKASTGIHDFKINSIVIEEVQGKNDNPDWKKGKVVFEVTKTIEGKDSVGKTIDYDILFPRDQESAEKLGKRLMHIFSKISTKDKIDNVKSAIQKLDLSSIDTLMAGIKKIADGRSLRLKVVGDKNRQYPVIPLYYAGYAETIDTNPSELVYNESTEGLLKKDFSKVENSTKVEDEDSLPF
jgi:hypothetical protein